MSSSRSLSLLALALALVACSSEPTVNAPVDGGSTPTDGGVPTDGGSVIGSEYCDVYRLACRRQVECGVGVVNQEETEEACALTASCDAMLADLKNSGQVVRQGDVNTCLAALKDATCTALANQRLGVSPACGLLHGGTKKENEACGGGVVNDCEPGLVCKADNACPGVCTRPPTPCTEGSCGAGKFCSTFGDCREKATAGADCDYVPFEAVTENSCVDGFFCSNDMKCIARGEENAVCSGGSTLGCAAGLGCIDGTCQTARQVGEDCSSADMCATGLYCDFNGGHCATRLSAGATCTNALGACGPGLTCVIANNSDSGTCVTIGTATPGPSDLRPIADIDGDCADAICPLGSTCKCTDSNCVIQRCHAAPKLGEKCTDSSSFNFDPMSCAEGICDIMGSQTCVRPQAVGADCNSFTPVTMACISGFCALGKCASSSTSACD